MQAAALAFITALLYVGFIGLQMRSYRRFFVQPHQGALSVPLLEIKQVESVEKVEETKVEADKRAMLARSVILIALILPIVLLAHDMAVLIDMGVEKAEHRSRSAA